MVCCIDPDAEYDVPTPPDHNDITATFTPLILEKEDLPKKQTGRPGTGPSG